MNGSPMLLDLVRDARNVETHQKGTVIFAEGSQGEHMYIVRQGCVELRYAGQVLEEVLPGSIFGEMILIGRWQRSATAIVKEACEVVPIDQKWFDLIIAKNPSLAREFMRIMADRLIAMNRRLGRESDSDLDKG